MPFDTKTYAAWKEEQTAILTSLRGKDVCLLFSGGKDSSLSLFFLLAASEEFSFDFEAHAAAFPKHRYTKSELDRINSFWKEKRVEIRWHDVEQPDHTLERVDNPCLLCQQTRKRLLYKATSGRPGDLVLVTAYTLWDLISYSLEYLMGTIYTHPDGEERQRSRKRFMETGQRFYPILKMDGAFTIYRPILRYNTQDVVRIIQEASIPILSVPCRYAKYRPKRILASYYESMGLHFDYDSLLEFAMEHLGLPSVNEYTSMSKEHFLKRVF